MKDSISVNDFQTVTRFDNFGGGWGYSGHSVEAIRFMADTDVVLGKNNFVFCDAEFYFRNYLILSLCSWFWNVWRPRRVHMQIEAV